jgi:hypothetical protein
VVHGWYGHDPVDLGVIGTVNMKVASEKKRASEVSLFPGPLRHWQMQELG